MSSSLWLLTTSYVRPEAEVDALLQAHVAHLQRQREAGHFLAWGRLVPRTGGFVIARAEDRAVVDALIDQDPFTTGGVATWTVTQWSVTGGHPLLVELLSEQPAAQDSEG